MVVGASPQVGPDGRLPLRKSAPPYDCRLRRHDHQIGKPTSDHPESLDRDTGAMKVGAVTRRIGSLPKNKVPSAWREPGH